MGETETKLPSRLLNWFDTCLDWFFKGTPIIGKSGWVWIVILLLTGLFLFGQFFNWGNIPFDFHDWAEISAPRIAFVQDAVRTGQFPLHMPDGSALRNVTDRYLSLPDVMLAPQMLLLGVLPVGWFVLINVCTMYLLGALGLVRIWQRLRLSPAAFTALFFLFNFNGSILSHFSMGHANYTGYFLFPWLFLLLMDLVETEKPFNLKNQSVWRWLAGYAFLLFFMLLNGSFHQFVWALMLTGLVGLFRWRNLLQALAGVIAAGLLSAFRLLPPALHLGKFDSEFLSGYPAVLDVWTGLTAMTGPEKAFAHTGQLTNLGWWEFDLYVGLVGAVFMLYFGLLWWLRNREVPAWLSRLALPAMVLFVLSIGRVYRLVMYIPIPLINGERVSARLITLPFILLLMAAIYAYQRFVDDHSKSELLLWVSLAGLFLMVQDLWQHLKLWRVNVAAEYFPVTPVDLAIKVVSNHTDAVYTDLLLVGLGITLTTAVLLMAGAVRKSKA